MIKVGIVGYGNLGRSLEALIDLEENMELVRIFLQEETLILLIMKEWSL